MSLSIDESNANKSTVKYELKKYKSPLIKASMPVNDEADSFVSRDKSKNNKFDTSEAAKNFAKGLISPITGLIKHPIAALALIGGTLAACIAVPVLGPISAIGFGALSLFQAGQGCIDAIKNYNDGEYDNAEKSFNKIGQGFIGTLMSALSIKQGARVAKEAKLMSELNVTALDKAQKTKIAAEVKNNGFINNLKENLSLFTSKEGLNSVFSQFKPAQIKERIQTVIKIIKSPRTIVSPSKTREQLVEEFKQSPEGLRRAALTDEQIEAEVNSLFNEVFEELGIPKEQRPKLEIKKGKMSRGGSYSQSRHVIEYNPESYKSGIMEMEDVMMHEATHCKEALLRAGIPQEQVNEVVKNELLQRVINGENEEIIIEPGFAGPEMATPPKLTVGLKKDFAQFAQENLYDSNKVLESLVDFYDQKRYALKKYDFADPAKLIKAEEGAKSLLNKLQVLLKKHPEFVSQYQSQEDALYALVQYSVSHNSRYKCLTNTKINVPIKPLEGDALKLAKQSLIDYISTVEGNARVAGLRAIVSTEKDFNQYQFSPEEVLAQRNGNNFLIKSLKAKLIQIRENGTLTPEYENFLNNLIQKAEKIIEFKTKGLEYYKKYTQMINNPDNEALKASVRALEKELQQLEKQITPELYERIQKFIVNFSTPGNGKPALTQLLNSLENNENI